MDELSQALQRIEVLEAALAASQKALEQALKRIEELERRLALSSNDSSKPPSTDSRKARKNRDKATPSGKRPGAQKGHKGHHRQMLPAEQVDEFILYVPTQCAHCDYVFETQEPNELLEPHQVFELHQKPIKVTEHRRAARTCPCCGHRQVSQVPKAHRQAFGPRLLSFMVVLTTIAQATRRQVQTLVRDLFGIPCALGTVQSALESATPALAPQIDAIEAHLQKSAVVGIDETSWHKGRQETWIWTVQDEHAALYRIQDKRSKESAQRMLNDVSAQVIHCDRYSAYSYLEDERVQACRAHLLRDFKAVAKEPGRVGEVGAALVGWEKKLHRARQQAQSQELSWAQFIEQAQKIKQAQEAQIGRLEEADRKGVLKWMLSEQGKRAWTFMEHEGLELTNNASERALRGPVTQRKISYGSKSDAGQALMQTLWSVHQTCKRLGVSSWQVFEQSLQAHRLGQLPNLLF